ncbi:diacylglycerol kinase family protein [Demequina lignilytica]|uniref:Diacylglycerol kinase family protein n=1 Tax=Demequina lignilytica TaxID=3051663 RepID=A0AB35MEV2_9MICO|nr:diacylglycerol kinase family protein [Demequina sp. SYSU T0a273]MDN4482284.1 diacylglycerol kinase family protein [Demequina sp. SYSU T0a273]
MLMGNSGTAGTAARRRFEPAAFGLALATFVVWTIAVTTGWAGRTVDTWWPDVELDPRSYFSQVLEAFALITNPFFIMVATAVMALQAYRRRHRHLAAALAIGAAGLPVWALVWKLIDRSRPETAFADSIAAAGPAYPSGQMVSVTILVWVTVTIANAQRRTLSERITRRLLGGLLVLSAALAQLLMQTSHLSDIVGGWLFGVMVGAAALWISGIDSISKAWAARKAPTGPTRKAAVIYNPTKIDDLETFRRRVAFTMASTGWASPIWLETREDDPGFEMARTAQEKQVDRVLVAGGDGTVRAVCAEMSGSEIPVAIIPAGTGNLLGRNLGIPLDEDEALELALVGTPRSVDVVHWTTDAGKDSFVVMAGVGLDAQIMRDTNETLKKMVKGGAYVLAGLQQLGSEQFQATVTVDGRVVHEGDALMTLVGNVGKLQGGIALLPSASAADGRLHVLVATNEGVSGLKRLGNALRRGGPMPFVRRARGKKVTVEIDREVPFQLDGDTEGTTTSFTAEVEAGALRVVAPRPSGQNES